MEIAGNKICFNVILFGHKMELSGNNNLASNVCFNINLSGMKIGLAGDNHVESKHVL